MGINFEDLFNQGVADIKEKADEFLRVGMPGLEVAAQQWGIDTLKRMQTESQGELNQAVNAVTQNSPAPGSFGAALNSTIKGTFLQTYGVHIMFGVAALILLGFYLKGK